MRRGPDWGGLREAGGGGVRGTGVKMGGVMGAWPEDWGAGEARWEAVEFGHKGVAVTCW